MNTFTHFLLIVFLSSSIQSNYLSGDEFPFTPPENFTLSSDYIALHHPVTTKSKRAQLYFDQGLTFLYAFNHDAAYWSFLKASQVDPDMAMAYWGMALSLGTNINMEMPSGRVEKTYDLTQKALQLSKNLPENEQDYIHAIAKRYAQDPKTDRTQLATDYSLAMKTLSKKYPDDPDASVLYAESLLDLRPWGQWTLEGKPVEGTISAIHALESVLKKYPNHLGANHYYIHTIEASKHPERALINAERLKTLLPSSGHILHMPAHIYLLVGDYHEAALNNEAAIIQDRKYIDKYGLKGIYPVHYYTHNLYFLSRAYSMEGNFTNANRAANQLSEFFMPHFKMMPELEYYLSSPLFTYIRFQRWKDVLDLPPYPEEMAITNVLRHYGRALAYLNLKESFKALEEQRLFNEKKAKLAPQLNYGYNTAANIVIIANFMLEAKFADSNGDSSKALDSYASAIAQQDALKYNEPPDWSFPIRESLGAYLFRNKNYAEAEKIFREDLSIHPRNGRALFGLRESLAAQNKDYDLYWVEKQFNKAWKYSDTTLNMNEL